MSEIKFNAKYLQLLSPYIARGDIRYYLEGVHISPRESGGAVLVATNGHAMLCVIDESAVCEKPVIFSVNADAIRKSKARSNARLDPVICSIDTETERLIIGREGIELYVQPNKCLIEGNFPDYKRVLPDFSKLSERVPQTLSIQVLNRLFLMGLSPRLGSAVRFWSDGQHGSPVIVQFSEYPEAVAVMMPFRAGGLDDKSILEFCSKFPKTE